MYDMSGRFIRKAAKPVEVRVKSWNLSIARLRLIAPHIACLLPVLHCIVWWCDATTTESVHTATEPTDLGALFGVSIGWYVRPRCLGADCVGSVHWLFAAALKRAQDCFDVAIV